MNRLIAGFISLLFLGALELSGADTPKFISASAVEPAVGRYLVTLSELASAEPPAALASRLAAQYGARIEPYSREGFRGFMIVAAPAKARLLSLDPRIASVVEQAVAGVAAPVASAPVMATPVVAATTASRAPHRVAANGGTTTTLGTYVYDGAGNISTITGTAGTEKYNYDPFNRVTRGELGSPLWQEYDYDRHGNITNIRTAAAAARKLAVDSDTNQIDHPGAAATDVSGTYSAAGNMETVQWTTGGLAATFAYDGLNVVTGATFGSLTRRHLYTASDERIASIDSSGNQRWTIRDAGGQVLRRFTRVNSTGALQWDEDYVYRGTAMLAAYVPAPEKVLHFFPDHLGTPRLITGNGGAKVSEHRYYPFGEEATPRGQDTEAKKFTGHERDTAGIAAAADLDYMHARYYGPALGRFLSLDPVKRREPLIKPQAWNQYAYTESNPLKYVDPDGEETKLAVGQRTDRNPVGHVAIIINETVYSFGTNWSRNGPTQRDWGASAQVYLDSQSGIRQTQLLTLDITPDQERRLQEHLDSNNPNAPGAPKYNEITNSCTTVVQNALVQTGTMPTARVGPITGRAPTAISTGTAILPATVGAYANGAGIVSKRETVGQPPKVSWARTLMNLLKERF